MHDLRQTAAGRLLADPAFKLLDQMILRHARVSTTSIYAQPRMEDLVAKVLEQYARPRPIGPISDAADVRELLGRSA